LVADDNDDMRALLTKTLTDAGYSILECRDGMELLEHFGSFSSIAASSVCDLIVSDIRMPGFTGLEILDFIHDNAGFPPVVLITAFGDEATHQQALKLGAVSILDKPFEMEELVRTVATALEADSHAGLSTQPAKVRMSREAGAPLDLVFRHMAPCPDITEHIHKSLSGLKRFTHEVIFIRIIIDIPHRSKSETRYFIRIILTIPGKVFVVSSEQLKKDIRQDPFTQITDLIAILHGHMEKHFLAKGTRRPADELTDHTNREHRESEA
jgi:CheY-like chemotaxis protein